MVEYTCGKCGWSGMVNGRPRCLACYRRYAAEWRRRHPEKARAQRQKWEARFRAERPGEYNRRRRLKRSKARLKESYERRKAWLAEGDVTRNELQEIYRRDGGKCVYCGCKVLGVRYNPNDPRGFDHVRARANGGRHTASNLVVCCKDCNAKKSA